MGGATCGTSAERKEIRRDFADLVQVRGYIRRHLAQRPEGDVEDTAWRYSLMNRGHDPLKE